MSDPVEATVSTAARLDVAVAESRPELSRSGAARLVREGRVRVDGVVVTRVSERVPAGARLSIEVPPPAPATALPQDLPLRIVWEDEQLAVIDKAAGMVVHPAPGHADGTLVNALLHHLDDLSGIGGEERPGIVHRLDRGTSGLLVVAKGDAAHRSLAAQFAAHTAGREYLAVVHGSPRDDRGRIESSLDRHPKDRLRFASTSGDRGRRAVTHWEVVGRAGTVSVVRCRLETGRTHQVRVHLSEQGWPIVGDALYGSRAQALPSALRALVDSSGDRPLLHAWKLTLEHPTHGERRAFVAPPPEDLQRVLDWLGISVG